MQPNTSTTNPPLLGSLWIDQTNKHRLVEVIRIVDHEHVLLQPVRDARLRPPRYIETTEHLAGLKYRRVTS